MDTDDRDLTPNLIPSGFFVIRSPLLPVDAFLQWSSGFEVPDFSKDAECFEKEWTRRQESLRKRLHDLMRSPHILESLYLASPGFTGRFEALDGGLPEKKARRFDQALARYYSRLCSRPTPYGLFAGITVGKIGSDTNLELQGHESYRRKSYVDIDGLTALVDGLACHPAVRDQIELVVNSSLHSIAPRHHYVKCTRRAEGYSIDPYAIEGSSVLEQILIYARSERTLDELSRQLCDLMPGIGQEKSQALVHDLRQQQVLVPAIRPSVTGSEPLDRLIDDLAELAAAADVVATLTELRDLLASIDADTGHALNRYRQIAKKLDLLPVPLGDHSPVRADLVKPGKHVTLSNDVLDEISAAVKFLHAWYDGPAPDPLQPFRQAFIERYGNREVRLVEALDTEVGVGLRAFDPGATNSPLLQNLRLDTSLSRDTPHISADRQEWLADRLKALLVNTDHELVLRDSDLIESADTGSRLPLPGDFAVKGSLSAIDGDSESMEEFHFHLHGVSGQPGIGALGRHSRMSSELRECIEDHYSRVAERQPGAIVAEVVYAPPGPVANLQIRPHLSNYEIPYLGRSTLPRDRQIPVEDLMVSIQGSEIGLRSARLDRRVIPRMSSAYDFRNDASIVCRFLSSVQRSGYLARLKWDWGPLADEPYLPRVRYGRTILAPATWNLGGDDIVALIDATGSHGFLNVRAWRKARSIPRYALFVDRDEKLFCDFDNPVSTDVFIDLMKSRRSVKLEEVYPPIDNLALSGPEGRFVHDLIIPFMSNEVPQRAQNTATVEKVRTRSRSIPDSNWLYLKIYAGPSTTDRLLRNFVTPLVANMDPAAFGSWHFVRYSDPDPHLRIRFQGQKEILSSEFFPQLEAELSALRQDGMVWRFTREIYEPESERYGGEDGIRLAEQLFCADSVSAVEILRSCPGDAGADTRWKLAMMGIHCLLDDFNQPLDARARILRQLRSSFEQEFGADKAPLKHQLGKQYREQRRAIETFLDTTTGPSAQMADGVTALRRRSDILRPIASALADLSHKQRLNRQVEDLVRDFIHMQCNRVLRWPSRAEEMVIYNFLSRYFDSCLARERRSS